MWCHKWMQFEWAPETKMTTRMLSMIHNAQANSDQNACQPLTVTTSRFTLAVGIPMEQQEYCKILQIVRGRNIIQITTSCIYSLISNLPQVLWRILKLHHHHHHHHQQQQQQQQQPVCCSCYIATPGATQLLGSCLVFFRDHPGDGHIGLTPRTLQNPSWGSPGGVPVSFINAKVSCIKDS